MNDNANIAVICPLSMAGGKPTECHPHCGFHHAEEGCVLVETVELFNHHATNLDYGDRAMTMADSIHVIASGIASDYDADENNVVDKLSHIEVMLDLIRDAVGYLQ